MEIAINSPTVSKNIYCSTYHGHLKRYPHTHIIRTPYQMWIHFKEMLDLGKVSIYLTLSLWAIV